MRYWYRELAGNKMEQFGQVLSEAKPTIANSTRKRHALEPSDRLTAVEGNLYCYFASFWVKLAP